jgi:hypothetical protein
MKTLALLLVGLSAMASDFPKVDADLATYDRTVAKKRLTQMVDIDQTMRGALSLPVEHGYSAAELAQFWKDFGPRWTRVDEGNTAELKNLLARYQWFTISEFGEEADNNAWLLVQHADRDLAFQKHVLQVLEKLYPKNETSRSNYAYLYDRVAAIGEKRPQRYGTQGHCVSKQQWEPDPIEAPEKLDERRREMGLGSMAEYKKQLVPICAKMP